MKKLLIILALASFCMSGTIRAQHMFDYSDIRSGKFSEKSVRGVRSMKDGEHYTTMVSGKIDKYSYKTGELTATVFNLTDHPQVNGRMSDYKFSPDETKMIVVANKVPIYRHSFVADHWLFDVGTGELTKLTEKGNEQEVTFSPDGRKVGFVRSNDIFVVDLADLSERQITEDGMFNYIINGHADWVYEEEYGFTRAFEFSPDSRKIAFLRFDESEVKDYTIMMYKDSLYPQPYTYKYPKAGEKNSVVTLHVHDLTNGQTVSIDTGKDRYLPRIGWTPEQELFYYSVNRLQNNFEVYTVSSDNVPKRIYSETDKRYVERPGKGTITFLQGKRFIVKNETSGWSHLYLYNYDKGVLTDTVTQGRWDVSSIVDVVGDKVYYISTEGSPLRTNLYRVKLNGKSKTRLTTGEGTYSVIPSAGFKYFISYFSNVSTPNVVSLHNGSGKMIRVLEDNAALKDLAFSKKVPRKEFFKFTTVQGTVLNGYMVKPADFEESRKYPVMMTQYSGPGSQSVKDRWSVNWTDVLVQEGYIVVCVDGRGTGSRGAEFKKCTYGNLGGYEAEDQISAAKYLATLPYVDGGRIGIQGWSFGGFTSLNCILKGNDIFKLAISVAPVTSWRFYDTIYTEIYNGLPQDNPRGYDENSPVNFADRLKGRLLLIHGTADDNVHVQNSYRMVDALVSAGKQFDLMIYPDDNHSMMPHGRHHVHELMINYVIQNL